MTQAPLVSIVVAAYNSWPEVELAIQSALCQSYRSIEVIVVDNSSTDATPDEVPKRYAGVVCYIRQPNTGDAGAYNTGLALAKGDLIQFLDGDDVLSPYKIERQVELFRSDPQLDIVYGDTRLFQAGEGTASLKDTKTGHEADLLATFLRSGGDYFGNTVGLLLRRAALERVGLWDETVYVTDSDYWLRAIWAGCRFRHCPDTLMGFVRVGPGKMSSNVTKMLYGHEALWNKALSYVTQEPYRHMIRRNLARIQFFLAIRRDGTTVRKALAKLFEARATCSTTVPLLACGVGAAVLLMPGGRTLACSPHFRRLRRTVARWVGYPITL